MVIAADAYEIELEGTNREIAALEPSAGGDLERRTRLAFRFYHRASLAGVDSGFAAAERVIDRAIAEFGPQEDLCLLKANLDFRFHRLAQVKRDLEMAPLLLGRFEGKSLAADLDFQHGRYDRAREGYEKAIQENCTWDNLARLAYFKRKMGDGDGADELYIQAENELTAKEMRSFAWLELQRGELHLARGRHDGAGAHYRRANAAYPGWWHVDEHLAELMAAEGRSEEAIELFQSVIERARKPELQQTLGELYVFIGRPDDAEPWFESALAAYLESVARGDVHYFHHLADFYADVREDGAEALKWARKDVELRDNFATQSAVAWALYLDGQLEEAARWMDRALSSGVQDAHLFSQAATIFEAAGRGGEATAFRRGAAILNPKYRSFHIHR